MGGCKLKNAPFFLCLALMIAPGAFCATVQANGSTTAAPRTDGSVTDQSSTTPKNPTPESSTPESSTPERSTPESSTPESSTPERSTPESSTPESSTPQGPSTSPDSLNSPSSKSGEPLPPSSIPSTPQSSTDPQTAPSPTSATAPTGDTTSDQSSSTAKNATPTPSRSDATHQPEAVTPTPSPTTPPNETNICKDPATNIAFFVSDEDATRSVERGINDTAKRYPWFTTAAIFEMRGIRSKKCGMKFYYKNDHSTDALQSTTKLINCTHWLRRYKAELSASADESSMIKGGKLLILVVNSRHSSAIMASALKSGWEILHFNITISHTGGSRSLLRSQEELTDLMGEEDTDPDIRVLNYKEWRDFERGFADTVGDICMERSPSLVSFPHMFFKSELVYVQMRVNFTVDDRTWAKERDFCERHGMGLMTPKSSGELKKLEEELEEILANSSRLSNATWLKIFVGIRRNTDVIGHPYEWVRGSPDLFHSHWATGQPNETTECALWRFERIKDRFKSRGWQSIGCGKRTEAISVCYVHRYSLRSNDTVVIPMEDEPMKDADLYAKGSFIKVAEEQGQRPVIKSLSQLVASGKMEQLIYIYPDLQIGGLVSEEMVPIKGDLKEELLRAIPHLYRKCASKRWSERNYGMSGRDGVAWVHVCDGRPQCTSGVDERYCGPHGQADCMSKFFECRSKECVLLSRRCDLIQDCHDKSDEDNCDSTMCEHKQCPDGTCLPRSLFGDGQNDCSDGADEQKSEKRDCMFLCNRNQCILPRQMNDSVRDCNGPEGPLDVDLKHVERIDCEVHRKTRHSPRCVMIRTELGGILGCRNLKHLSECETFTCPKGYLKCPNSYCIPHAYVGDGRHDCIRGEDEHNVQKPDPSRFFLCAEKSNQSVNLEALCNGKADCPGGEDEVDCGYPRFPGFLSLAGALSSFRYKPDKDKPFEGLAKVDPRTRYLDLSGIPLPEFFLTYPDGNLTHLLVLNLSNTGISDVFRHARDKLKSERFCEQKFRIRDLKSVVSINLSYNNISEVPEDCSVLQLMKGLRHLNLSHNPHLTGLTRESLISMEALRSLDLSYTGFQQFDENVFVGLDKLKFLSLKGIPLVSLDVEFPKELESLNLEVDEQVLLNDTKLKRANNLKEMRASHYSFCCPQVTGKTGSNDDFVCHAPEDPISSCTDLAKSEAIQSLLWTFGLSAVLINLAALFYRLVWDRKTLTTPRCLFMTSLCVSDLIMGAYLIMIATYDLKFKGEYVYHQKWWRHSKPCQIAGTLAHLSSVTSACLCVLMTLDQVQIVRYPHGRKCFNVRTTLLAIGLAWMCSVVAVIPPLLPLAKDWDIFSLNSMCLALVFGEKRPHGWIYAVFLFVGLIGILYCITCIGQLSIYSVSRSTGRKFHRRMRFVKQKTVDERLLELSMARRVSRITMSNFLCWAYVSITSLLVVMGEKVNTDVYTWTLVIVIPINSVLNPIIYFYPAFSKFMDSMRLKRQRNGKPEDSSDISDMKRPATTMTSDGGSDTVMSEEEEQPLEDRELLERCCEDMEELAEILDEEDSSGQSEVNEEDEITREDIEMLRAELDELTECIRDVALSADPDNVKETTTDGTDLTEAADNDKNQLLDDGGIYVGDDPDPDDGGVYVGEDSAGDGKNLKDVHGDMSDSVEGINEHGIYVGVVKRKSEEKV